MSYNKEILKAIWRKEEALKQNLLPSSEAQLLYDAPIKHLGDTLNDDSIPTLKFKKMRAGKPDTWWTSSDGYPVNNPWARMEPYLVLLAQYESGRTIKSRFEAEGLFVETRYQGDDLNILVGKRDGSLEKAHIFIGDKTGEIRIENNQQDPSDLGIKIETVLTLPSGKKIKTRREAIEELEN